ncbi:MAG: metal-dependent transcriptional regulator [Desulfovibrio sp.]|nr:metal-dependent transcriptional regulator [Desulfovibrio sp.]
MHLRTFRHEARDDYLEAILLITRAKGHCRAIHIAEALQVSKPSVSIELGKLQGLGLITVDEDKLIRFTEAGQALAELTYAKHSYFKRFLLSVGVDEETAEREACALEHAICGDSFQKIRTRYPLL